MKKILIVIVFASNLIFVPSANAARDTDRAKLLEQIEVLLEQVQQLQKLLAQKNQNNTFSSIILSPSAVIKSRYKVYDATNTAWIKNQKDQNLIDRFVELSPDEFDSRYNEFVIFDDPQQDIDAFVETLTGFNSWRVGFSTFAVSQPADDNASTELLVHELGHIVAYEQINGEAYQDIFKDTFWTNNKRWFGFVSGYAEENSDEDFAESFMTFVLETKYIGEGKEKVDFFYQYPELVQYRAEIRSNL